VDHLAVAAFVIPAGNLDAHVLDAPVQKRDLLLRRPLGTLRIVGVVALHGIISERQVTRRPRQRSCMIEARNEWKSSRATYPSEGGLKPKQAAQRSEHADRSV